MSKKDDTVFIEGQPAVTTVSPYKNMNLVYKNSDASTSSVSNSQLRLACLEASVAFHEDKAEDDPAVVVETATQFWQFVNNDE